MQLTDHVSAGRFDAAQGSSRSATACKTLRILFPFHVTVKPFFDRGASSNGPGDIAPRGSRTSSGKLHRHEMRCRLCCQLKLWHRDAMNRGGGQGGRASRFIPVKKNGRHEYLQRVSTHRVDGQGARWRSGGRTGSFPHGQGRRPLFPIARDCGRPQTQPRFAPRRLKMRSTCL